MNIYNKLYKMIICSGMLLSGSMANAGLIITAENDNQDVDNVLSNTCSGNITGPAFTVQGCLNTDHTFLINFTSDENLLLNGGQATLEAVDGAFSFLEIALDAEDYVFEKLVLNIDASLDGFVTFTGVPGGTSDPFALDAGGQNYFTITGESFTSISFFTTVGVASIDLVSDLSQIRLGGVSSVPEPTTLGMLGLGLIGLSVATRRKPII